MWINLGLSIASALGGFALWLRHDTPHLLIFCCGLLTVWQLYSALTHSSPRGQIILRLGGFGWTMEDFCRGWLITGETGSGKTLGGINTMLWQVSQNCRNWGGVCVDDKGLYAQTLARMLERVGRRDDLIVLEVRPDGAPPDWKPPHTLNFLEDPYLPWSGKAKIVCDVAVAQGQRTDQSFFRTQAQVQIEFAFRVLAAAGVPVTLETAYDLLTSKETLEDVMLLVLSHAPPAEAEQLTDHYLTNFLAQPPEQLGGVKTTVANYLKYFTEPDITAVFCPKATSTVSLGDVDRGKILCVSVPQRFHVERRYIHISYLVQRLEDRLAGRHETEVLRTHPDDHCQLGVLAPWTRELDAEEQPEEIIVEEARADLPARPAPAPPPPAEAAAAGERNPAAEPFSAREDAGRRPPSSLGVAVALQPEAGAIVLTVKARCTVYSRQFPDFAAQRQELGNRAPDQVVAGERQHVSLVEKFRRHRLELPPVTFTLQPGVIQVLDDGGIVQPALDQLTAQLRADPNTLRAFAGNRIVPVAALRDEAGFQNFLQTLRGPPELAALRASIRLRARPTDTGLRVEVHLCNDSTRDLLRPSNDKYSSLYDAAVELTLRHGTLSPVELLPVPQDYQYDRNVYALGRNAGAMISPDGRTVRTSALARCEQPRLTTQDRVVARYSDLADDPLRVLATIQAAMEDYARDWADRVIGGNALGLGPDELAACRNDWEAFNEEISGFCAGIAALHTDPRLLVAFRAMNRAFAPPRGRFPAWRLFQIVFIVTQLPALAVRENITRGEWPLGTPHDWSDILERADVLWFPTGGGKTEAYLGLVGCAALYDRLRGKMQGVCAWLRFPLRMLSVQQLQRAVRMVWQIDQQRLALEPEHGNLGEPFSLGYFVGSANTPNSFREQWSFDRLETDDRQRERLLLVPDCPACGTEDCVEIRLDRANQRVHHVCRSCRVTLPVYVSDDEIFRFLPTLLVGTVDKIAAIGWQAKVASLWLGPPVRCAHAEHGYVHGEWCVQGCNTNPNAKGVKPRRIPVVAHDPAPSLHIQDELHLLQEELGAFAGHYETMVRANEAASSGRPAKVIAATATIAGYAHQTRHIYGVREVRRFPNRGYSLSQTFYSILERQTGAADAPPKVARFFTAFRPPFLRPADAAARCSEILHEAINQLQGDPLAAIATVGLVDATTADEVRALLAYYSRTLTYVGKKDSGIRICQRLEQNSAKDGSSLRPGGTRELNVNYLSAHSTLKEIAATIKRAESPTPWTAPNHLDATVATHVISHGVDVEYYNLMFLERIPEQISDYIQVSSRSGRQHVGLVLAVLPRYSLRASSIYDRFSEFHRHLDRMVLPVPVNRFAKAAAARSFPGVLLGALYGRHLAALTGTRAQQLRLVARGVSTGQGALTRESLHTALRASYALDDRIYDPSLEGQMGDGIEQFWQGFLYEVRHPQHDDLTKVFNPKPMSSLRDVDVTVPFRPDNASMNYQDLLWFEQA